MSKDNTGVLSKKELKYITVILKKDGLTEIGRDYIVDFIEEQSNKIESLTAERDKFLKELNIVRGDNNRLAKLHDNLTAERDHLKAENEELKNELKELKDRLADKALDHAFEHF